MFVHIYTSLLISYGLAQNIQKVLYSSNTTDSHLQAGLSTPTSSNIENRWGRDVR